MSSKNIVVCEIQPSNADAQCSPPKKHTCRIVYTRRRSHETGRLHVGAERGVNCEHMQALVTKIFQRHWERQEERQTDLQPSMYRNNRAFMASLDVKTALDVAKPSVAFETLILTGSSGAAMSAGRPADDEFNDSGGGD